MTKRNKDLNHNKENAANLYEKIVHWFDHNRCKTLMEKEYLDLILRSVPKNGSVLDLGCGTGEPLAKYFIEQGFSVTGVDSSPQMIQLCKKRFRNMDWVVGDMRTINLNRKFNVVIAWDSFFHLAPSEQKNMFHIFQMHLEELGILLFTSGPKSGEVYSNMNGYEFYHASLDPEEYKTLLNDYGFTLLLNKIEDPNCGMHTVWVAQKYKRVP